MHCQWPTGISGADMISLSLLTEVKPKPKLRPVRSLTMSNMTTKNQKNPPFAKLAHLACDKFSKLQPSLTLLGLT